MSAAPQATARSVQEGLSLGGRSALIEGPASVPSSHAPRTIAHGIGIEEGPVGPVAPRDVKVVSPGKVQDVTVTGTYAMLLPADKGAPDQWLQMLLVSDLGAPPPPSFFGVQGASSVTWKYPIPSPSRELVSCISFEALDPLVEVHGDKEARFVVGGRYVGTSAFTDVIGAFVVDGDVYLWLARDGQTELVDLAAGVTRRAPDPPKRSEPIAGKARCPMR